MYLQLHSLANVHTYHLLNSIANYHGPQVFSLLFALIALFDFQRYFFCSALIHMVKTQTVGFSVAQNVEKKGQALPPSSLPGVPVYLQHLQL